MFIYNEQSLIGSVFIQEVFNFRKKESPLHVTNFSYMEDIRWYLLLLWPDLSGHQVKVNPSGKWYSWENVVVQHAEEIAWLKAELCVFQ